MLLNRAGDVSPDGRYVPKIKVGCHLVEQHEDKNIPQDSSKKFGAAMSNVSSGRVGVVNIANTNLQVSNGNKTIQPVGEYINHI